MRIPVTAMNASDRIIRGGSDFYLKRNEFARARARSSGPKAERIKDRVARGTTKKYTNKSAPSGELRRQDWWGRETSRAQLRAVTLAAAAAESGSLSHSRDTLSRFAASTEFGVFSISYGAYTYIHTYAHTHTHSTLTYREGREEARGERPIRGRRLRSLLNATPQTANKG